MYICRQVEYRKQEFFYLEESLRSFVSNTKTHTYAYDFCDRVPSLWQGRLCVRIFATSRMEILFHPLAQILPIRLLYQHVGKSTFRTGGITNSAMHCSSRGHCSQHEYLLIHLLLFWELAASITVLPGNQKSTCIRR